MEARDHFRERLLRWYDAERRDLPWRAAAGSTPDPYHVWLSEIMLQQTRVDTVRAYFLRWLERFPTLESLSRATQDEVLKAWEGLGYYSRARNLHRAVREVRTKYGGRVPEDPEAFLALPGVGRYTAGAVMSIAFGREEPVVDGNVRRVFARVLDLPDPPAATLWAEATALVRGERPGDLNQALMELGALVCTPRSPACGACPVADHCRARAAGTQAARPARRGARAIPTEHHVVAVVRQADELLVVRRPDRARLGGLWEFPGLERKPGEGSQDAAVRAVRELIGLEITDLRPLGTVRHAFTHVRVTYEAMLATPQDDERGAEGGSAPRGHVLWVTREGLARLALPRAQHRIAELLDAGSEGASGDVRPVSIQS
ncbi:MAG: A/G-specific adenine glycosylase [Gemmatimonadota bacterium]